MDFHFSWLHPFAWPLPTCSHMSFGFMYSILYSGFVVVIFFCVCGRKTTENEQTFFRVYNNLLVMCQCFSFDSSTSLKPHRNTKCIMYGILKLRFLCVKCIEWNYCNSWLLNEVREIFIAKISLQPKTKKEEKIKSCMVVMVY